LCIVKFTAHLLSDEILLAVREWEWERMGITNGNGNKARLNLGLGVGMHHREWEGMGLKKKTFPLISSSDELFRETSWCNLLYFITRSLHYPNAI